MCANPRLYYVPQYVLSIVTLPCVIVIAIRLIGES